MTRWLPWLLVAAVHAAVHAADPAPLWRVGQADKSYAEFALAPNGYARFVDDGLFVVGRSSAKDWPYVHPGPQDGWAGSRAHTFTVVFGLRQAPTEGSCRLLIDLVDTHYGTPPVLTVVVGQQRYPQKLPAGRDDQAIFGNPAKGNPHRCVVEFPARLLVAGRNQIDLVNDRGSWLLYDALALEAPAGLELAPVTAGARLAVRPLKALAEREGKLYQPLLADITNYSDLTAGNVKLGATDLGPVALKGGRSTVELLAPAVAKETSGTLTLTAGDQVLATTNVTLTPVRHWTVYILLHSHVDIGYTDLQPNIAKKQARNVERALELIQETKDWPAGSRFKWNLEVFWPAEMFLATATPAQRQALVEAVRTGGIGVEGMYSNLLTGVCRAEELVRQFTFAARFGRECGATVDAMSISDVPGLTWGTVPALAHAGLRYISNGPNPGDRIGYVREAWEDKPFWWVSPSGRERVLHWHHHGGYAIGHGVDHIADAVQRTLTDLERANHPYDITALRWSKGDNGSADERVMRVVRDWNERYAWPKLIIGTTSEAFRAFERAYGDKLPVARGDFTPYWEDGVGSAARETALNRHSADRLVAAEALSAMLAPSRYPAAEFGAAWRNAAMWSEHTWGAHCSIHQPDNPFTLTQWKYKQAYALDADTQSRKLLADALAGRGAASASVAQVDVFNTSSWPRTDLVELPAEWKLAGDQVTEPDGRPALSQRLASGALAFLAREVPPFGARRYRLVARPLPPGGQARVAGTTLTTPTLRLTLDPATGDLTSLRRTGLDAELVAAAGANGYLYLLGGNAKDARPQGPATVRVRDAGPLVVSLVAESAAPGCRKLVREVRLVDGLDRVDLFDTLDKERVRAVEGVHVGFAFNVPEPRVRINSALAVAEPEHDQLAGACKNWFSVERWVDVSNDRYGVTWSTADVPLVELGGLTANLPRSQPNPRAYLATIAPSATLFAWAMNNHWHTNYKADQEGLVTLRFGLQPHAAYDAAQAARFGVESTDPLLVAPASGPDPSGSRVTLSPGGVLALALKPSDDGKGLILRLFGASGRDEQVTLTWAAPQPRSVWLSDALEQPLSPVTGAISVPAWGLVTVRAE